MCNFRLRQRQSCYLPFWVLRLVQFLWKQPWIKVLILCHHRSTCFALQSPPVRVFNSFSSSFRRRDWTIGQFVNRYKGSTYFFKSFFLTSLVNVRLCAGVRRATFCFFQAGCMCEEVNIQSQDHCLRFASGGAQSSLVLFWHRLHRAECCFLQQRSFLTFLLLHSFSYGWVVRRSFCWGDGWGDPYWRQGGIMTFLFLFYFMCSSPVACGF